MPDVTDRDARCAAAQVREWMATMRDSEDLVSVGAYVPGSNPRWTRRSRGATPSTRSCDSRSRTCTAAQAIEDLDVLTGRPPSAEQKR